MQQSIVKITSIQHITHDVIQIFTKKPQHHNFIPGQATEVAINKTGWEDEKRPFTFTCIPSSPYLEFIVKTYPSRKGVTNELLQLKENDELILHEVFGAITYKNQGVFVAGGAGITPFISIFRDLQAKNDIGLNKLLFANKTKGDIILEAELETILGENFINILSNEHTQKFAYGLITENFLKEHIDSSFKNFYLCGPPQMMEAIEMHLKNLNIDENIIVKETF